MEGDNITQKYKKIIVIIFVIGLVSVLQFTFVSAGPYDNWTRYSGNPFFDTGDYNNNDAPDNGRILKSPVTGQPMKYDGYYWMCFSDTEGTGQNCSIHLIKSSDLYSWSWDSIAISNQDSNPQSGEEVIQCTDFVYIEGTNKPFWIYYFGQELDGERNIRVAYSNNMNSWEREENNPIFTVSYSPNEAEDFNVWKYADNHWIAVYERNDYAGHECVYHAQVQTQYPNETWTNLGSLFSDSGDTGWSANPCIIGDADDNIFVFYEDVATLKYTKMRYVNKTDFFTYSAWGTSGVNLLPAPVPAYEKVDGNQYTRPNGVCFNNTDGTAEIIVCYTAKEQATKQLCLVVSDFTVNVSFYPEETFNLSFNSINNQANNTITTSKITVFNWTKVQDAQRYELQGANDSAFTDVFLYLNDINFANYGGSGNYVEYSDSVVFTLPVANQSDWYGKYYFRVRVFYYVF